MSTLLCSGESSSQTPVCSAGAILLKQRDDTAFIESMGVNVALFDYPYKSVSLLVFGFMDGVFFACFNHPDSDIQNAFYNA